MSRYRARLSGPLLDRLDLHVDVPALSFAEMHSKAPGEPSHAVRERVMQARDVMARRQGVANALLKPADLRSLTRLSDAASGLLQVAVDKFGLSGRAHDRVLQVALTVRDLARPGKGTPLVLEADEVAEALAFRRLDRRQISVTLPEASA